MKTKNRVGKSLGDMKKKIDRLDTSVLHIKTVSPKSPKLKDADP
ncbi:hypothetical protein [Vreelandella aquamarina]|nr:hypothetical protein [Halomonas meridiana]